MMFHDYVVEFSLFCKQEVLSKATNKMSPLQKLVETQMFGQRDDLFTLFLPLFGFYADEYGSVSQILSQKGIVAGMSEGSGRLRPIDRRRGNPQYRTLGPGGAQRDRRRTAADG